MIRRLVTLILLIAGANAYAQERLDVARVREEMVAKFLEKEGIKNPRVLASMRKVPRHEFVATPLRPRAYVDAALPIGYRQTISPPFVVAYMTQVLDPQPADRVLEIGTGSGYQAAVLSDLVKEVYTIEIVEQLGTTAARRLKRLGYRNVHAKVGDGYLGWAEHAPFDRIIVTCSPEDIPKPLVEQLREGGKMIIPIGERFEQALYLMEKKGGKLTPSRLIPTLFVPMTGASEKERKILPDPLKPAIRNGGFEMLGDDGTPTSWHYQRQLTVVREGAPEGGTYVQFKNSESDQAAMCLQGMAVDGRKLGALRITCSFRGADLPAVVDPGQRPGIMVHFYDDGRRSAGDVLAWRARDSAEWQPVETTIAIPQQAREAILRIGLNGSTGQLSIDNLAVKAEPRPR